MKLQFKFWLVLLFACDASSYSYNQFKQRDTKLDTLSSLSQQNNSDHNAFSMQSNEEDEDYIDDEDLNKKTTTISTSTPKSKSIDDEELENEIFEDEIASTTTTSRSRLGSVTTSSAANDVLYDNDENDESAGDYDDNQTNDDENTTSESKIDPYNCPSVCKCKFNKIDLKTNKIEEENEYEDTEDSNKKKRQFNEDQDIQNNKYRIEVDCSSASLFNLRNLFEDEFPLDQIVTLLVNYFILYL